MGHGLGFKVSVSGCRTHSPVETLQLELRCELHCLGSECWAHVKMLNSPIRSMRCMLQTEIPADARVVIGDSLARNFRIPDHPTVIPCSVLCRLAST